MKARKTDEANQENRKGLYFQIGLVVALALVLFLFNYRTYEKDPNAWLMGDVDIEDEDVPITVRPPEPPPPPPAPPEVIQVVEDELEIEEIELESTELTDDTEIELIEEVAEASDEVFSFVNVQNRPVFPGCEDEPSEDARFNCFLIKTKAFLANRFEFPEMSRQMGSSGRVFVDFIIERDGSVSNVRIARTSGDDYIDREALRVVRQLPKMTPAKNGGRPVRMNYTIPINAQLQ